LVKQTNLKRKKIGEYILEDSVDIIDESHRSLGARFILLDAINNDKLISFYQKNLFFPIEKSITDESIKMIKPYFESIEYE